MPGPNSRTDSTQRDPVRPFCPASRMARCAVSFWRAAWESKSPAVWAGWMWTCREVLGLRVCGRGHCPVRVLDGETGREIPRATFGSPHGTLETIV